MEVHIKGSKCDQFAEGIKLVVGETGSDLCPCSSSYIGYLVQRGIGPGPVFLIKDGCLLTHEWFVSALCSALRDSGIHPAFACWPQLPCGCSNNGSTLRYAGL